MIGNMCKLDLDECATCGKDALLERLRIFAELNDGDVLAESVSFVCTVVCSGAFITNRIDLIAHIQSIEIETKW